MDGRFEQGQQEEGLAEGILRGALEAVPVRQRDDPGAPEESGPPDLRGVGGISDGSGGLREVVDAHLRAVALRTAGLCDMGTGDTVGGWRGVRLPAQPLGPLVDESIDRSCHSPGAAEDGDDALYYTRYQWSEILYGNVNVREPDETVKKTPGYLIAELITEVLVIKGAEKRANIELLSAKDSQLTTGLEVRWVHSAAQLANGLTKAGASREFELYYKIGGRWRIVEDPTMMSARRRKQQGLEPLQKETERPIWFSEDSDYVWGPGAMQVLAEVYHLSCETHTMHPAAV